MAFLSVKLAILTAACLHCVLKSECYENRRRTMQRFVSNNKRPLNLAPNYKDEYVLYSKEGTWQPMNVQHPMAHSKHKRPFSNSQKNHGNIELTTESRINTSNQTTLSTALPNMSQEKNRTQSQRPRRKQEVAQESKRIPHYEVHEEVDDLPQFSKHNVRDNRHKYPEYSRKVVKPLVYRKTPYYSRYHVSKEPFVQRHYRKPELHHNFLRPIKRIL